MVIGQHVFKNLLQENIPQPQIEAVLSECENISYQKTSSRRVLGSMNELIKHLEYFISSEGGLEKTDFYELNRELNRIILAATNHKRPIELLKERLKEITPTTRLIDFLFAIPSNACHTTQHTLKGGGRPCSRVHDVTNTSTQSRN
ncbi:MAG: hypothetical protein P4M12_02020, partial [Gammaproteobacteria bacterium]|nr:hypothetical protein [Gammaproteobacteria bacterium]